MQVADILSALLKRVLDVLEFQIPWAIGLSILFTILTLFKSQACNPGRPWWKSRDLFTDTHYFFLVPVISPYAKLIVTVLIAAMMQNFMSEAEVIGYFTEGRGPVGRLPFWAQVAFYLFAADFLLYWTHRTFHNMVLWPFHAVHHSSVDVDWTTAYRSHPVNQMLGSGLVTVIMLIAGVPPALMIALVPFDTITAAFVHANLNWTFGPLKYVIATPVFHRWHHTGVAEGGDSNFSSTFSIWDYLFGTFYMPEGVLPQEYGIDDPLFPTSWAGQMVVPFRQFLDRIQTTPKDTPAQ